MILKLLRPARLIVGKGPARCSTCGVELDCLDLPGGFEFCCASGYANGLYYCALPAS